MSKPNELPKGHVPYGLLNFCSNKLRGGVSVLSDQGVLPLVIGKGPKPQIWIQAIEGGEGSRKYVLLVDASISRSPLVRVEEVGSEIVVSINGETILRIEQTGDDEAVVSEIDLRAIGFNVRGNLSELKVGSSTFSNNTISNLDALVAIM